MSVFQNFKTMPSFCRNSIPESSASNQQAYPGEYMRVELSANQLSGGYNYFSSNQRHGSAASQQSVSSSNFSDNPGFGSTSSLQNYREIPRSSSASSQQSLPAGLSSFSENTRSGSTSSMQNIPVSNLAEKSKSGSTSNLPKFNHSPVQELSSGFSPMHRQRQSLHHNAEPAGCSMCLQHWEDLCTRQVEALQEQINLQEKTIQKLNQTLDFLMLKIDQFEFYSNKQQQQLTEILQTIKPSLNRNRPQTVPTQTSPKQVPFPSPKHTAEDRRMKKVQEVISNKLRQDDTFRFFRHFYNQQNVESVICDIKRMDSEYERTNRVFTEIKKLGSKNFNPEVIHQYFTDRGLLECADEIVPFLKSKKGWNCKKNKVEQRNCKITSSEFSQDSRPRRNGFICTTTTVETFTQRHAKNNSAPP